ncbi:hypothetical protein ACFYW1_02965 [Streptomyces sp. NPDC002669]|uniref:hypothetical protein n=1 Tax=Streptomyces sp. NPDC002669 TaxID=3364658 RepID=UPI0036A3306E
MRTRYEPADAHPGRASGHLRIAVLVMLAAPTVLAVGTDRSWPDTDSIRSNTLA